MNQSRQLQVGDFKTLGDFNNRLEEVGFTKVSSRKLKELMEHCSRDTLVRALISAQKDQRSLMFLNNHFTPMSSDSPDNEQASTAGSPDRTTDSNNNQSESEANTQNKSAASPPVDDDAPTDRLNKHVYGGKSAVCFGTDTTRTNSHTIAVDGAMSKGNRAYDWKDKVRIQMTTAELPFVLSVFMGYIDECEFKSHGPKNDRGFSIKRQSDDFFISIFAKDKGARGVKIPPGDAYDVTTMILRQMRKNAPHMTTTEVINLVKVMVNHKR